LPFNFKILLADWSDIVIHVPILLLLVEKVYESGHQVRVVISIPMRRLL
jgi:hypothetical protein